MHYFDHLNRFTIRKNSLKCQNTNLSVIKTIRVHLDGILPWIEKHPSLKVGTPCPQKKLSVCFLAISQLKLGQIQKVRSVLKTTGSENFKTVLTFEIWPSRS